MAFLLRQISHSADGREIVRPARIEGELLTIGRDPARDVHLTDLAVALHHATLERVGPGRLNVKAEQGLSLELNGRKITSGAIDLPAGGDIRIASHLLRIMPVPAGSDEVAIDIEKVTEGEGRLDSADAGKFSLAAVMPGKRVTAWLFVLAVLGFALAWPIKAYYDRQQPRGDPQSFHADTMWSSGKLSRAHAGLEKNCKACHVKAFEAVRDPSCKACHSEVHDHANPFRLARAQPDLSRWGWIELGFRETFKLPRGRCVECHTEHEGPQVMPATAQRFCSDCHTALDDKLPDMRLLNASDFGTGHPQFRPALLTGWQSDRPQMRRVSLDARPRENSGLKFPHAMHLSPSNGVAQMAWRLGGDYGFGRKLECKDCHDPSPDGARFQPVAMEEDCAMCHSLAFDRQGGTLRTLRHGEPAQVVADLRDFYRARLASPPATLGGMARRRPGDTLLAQDRRQFAIGSSARGQAERAIRAVFSRGGACYDCHIVDPSGAGSSNFRIRPVAFPIRYMHKGWFDHAAHPTDTCASCHKADRSNAASDLLLPDLQSCRTCHGGEGSATRVPSSCAMCHDYHMDEGQPAMLIRQRVRGKKRDLVTANADGAADRRGRN